MAHSPSLQWAINSTCLTTGVFLVLFGWRILTPEIPWATRNTLSHLDLIFPPSGSMNILFFSSRKVSRMVESNQELCHSITHSVPCFGDLFPPLPPTLTIVKRRVKQRSLECFKKYFFWLLHFHDLIQNIGNPEWYTRYPPLSDQNLACSGWF